MLVFILHYILASYPDPLPVFQRQTLTTGKGSGYKASISGLGIKFEFLPGVLANISYLHAELCIHVHALSPP